jgi:hypothetical protein
MRLRFALALGLAALLVVGALVFRSPESDPEDALAAIPPPPLPTSGPTEAPAAEGAAVAEVPDTSDPYAHLIGDGLEAALPELVEQAKAGNDHARDAVLRGLEDPGNQARERSVLALGSIGDRSLTQRLEPLLSDRDPDVREAMVKALVRLGGPDAKPLLVDLVRDEDPDVVEDAMQALVSAEYTQAIGVIREVLANSSRPLSTYAASALRQLGDHESANTALAQVALGLDSSSAIVRREAIGEIRTIGGSEALAYLHQALADPDPALRRDVARAISAVTESLEE